MGNVYDIVIVGAGPAGLSAGIYGVRAGKTVLCLEAASYGGQIINTPEVENYPGIAKTSGYEFATALYNQAKNLGVEVKFEKVKGVEVDGDIRLVKTRKNTYECKAVIIATGAKNKKLGLESENAYIGAGISYCATCDGAFYKDQEVAVVGGGNTAIEDALYLSNTCSKVYLIHRRDAFRAEASLVESLKQKPNVEFILNSIVSELVGNNGLDSVTVESRITGEKTSLPISCLFVAIGQEPQNGAFSNILDIDESGYVIADESCKTEVPGIFTAGDCRTKEVRQLTTAASDGAIAAMAACSYIN